MSQAALPFFESDKAATKFAIQVSGKEPKAIAHALWPNKTVERAQTDLLNALNENRESQLSADEHVFIANYCGRYDWLYYSAHRCSHSRPTPQTPEEVSAGRAVCQGRRAAGNPRADRIPEAKAEGRMTFQFEHHDDIFLLLPVIAFGRVGNRAERGVAVGWLFWIVCITGAA